MLEFYENVKSDSDLLFLNKKENKKNIRKNLWQKIPENFESGQSIGKIKSEKCMLEAMVQ